jgi:hypothetical protein
MGCVEADTAVCFSSKTNVDFWEIGMIVVEAVRVG